MTLTLRSVRRIWDAAPHNAFTDLVRHGGLWFCAFREGETHAQCVGSIRILASSDGAEWRSAALLEEPGIDLRDPHFFLADESTLALVAGGTRIVDGTSVGRRPRIFRSADGFTWSAPTEVAQEGDWLWRVAAARGRFWSVSYRVPERRRWTVHLMESADAVSWRDFLPLKLRGLPNEAALCFKRDGTALALVRRERGQAIALLGSSAPPFTRWKWRRTGVRVGGPQLIELSDGTLVAGYRRLVRRGGKLDARTVLASFRGSRLVPLLELPSGGDCSYPGLVEHEGALRVSYYSSHEGKASIYCAIVDINK